MVFTKHKMFAPAVLTTCLLVFSASPILAQDTTNPAGSRTVASGQKMKLKGVVTRRDADTFTVRDMNGVDTVVRLDDRTSVKTKGGFLRGGTNYAQTSILRGLNVEIEGRGNGQVNLQPRRSGSMKQTCALRARLNRALRRSKREPRH
jgi:endonuclease YncB( thermonuclease family)